MSFVGLAIPLTNTVRVTLFWRRILDQDANERIRRGSFSHLLWAVCSVIGFLDMIMLILTPISIASGMSSSIVVAFFSLSVVFYALLSCSFFLAKIVSRIPLVNIATSTQYGVI